MNTLINNGHYVVTTQRTTKGDTIFISKRRSAEQIQIPLPVFEDITRLLHQSRASETPATNQKIVFPEHEKLHKIAEQSQAIGDFLAWLQAEKGWELGKEHEHDEDTCYHSDGMHRMCGLGEGDHEMARYDKTDLLAEFFKIDQKKLEAEKRSMLEQMRKKA